MVVQKTLTVAQYNASVASEAPNLDDFLNSLFDPWPGPFAANPPPLFRAGLLTDIKAGEVDGQAIPRGQWLIDAASQGLLKTILRGYWDPAWYDPHTYRPIATDMNLIELIAGYVAANDLHLLVPSFVCVGKNATTPSRYRYDPPQTYAFRDGGGAWIQATIDRFLELFLRRGGVGCG